MAINISISISILISSFCFANYPIFEIKEPWEFVQLEKSPPSIEMTFIKKIGKLMPLSATFAREKTERTQTDYLQFIIQMYQREENFTVHSLGQLGPSSLLQIYSSNADFGPMKIWQAIQVIDSVAYVLTLSGPQDGFEKNEVEVEKILKSFRVLKNPQEILSKKKRSALNLLIQNLQNCAHFQKGGFSDPDFQESELFAFKKKIIEEYAQYGPIWQLQLLAYLSTNLSRE